MEKINMFWKRAGLIQAIRRFFVERGYLEVDTPVRIPCQAPEAHIEQEPAGGWFLQTSPEICMKRLLAGGCSKIFQICKCFRCNERGSRHTPEFTMLEWYRAGCDYHGLMAECRELLVYAYQTAGPESAGQAVGRTWSLQGSWEQLTVAEAFRRYAPVSVAEAMENDTFEETLCLHVEPQLGVQRPVFLHDYPAALSSLARLKKAEPAVAERFELYINGLEIANGFSELIDSAEQRQRFEKEIALTQALGKKPGPLPEKFLAELERMPEAAGIALGVDRLAMVFFGAATIDEVLTFTPEEL
jgi:lysyl-tRNA synthetase class 2